MKFPICLINPFARIHTAYWKSGQCVIIVSAFCIREPTQSIVPCHKYVPHITRITLTALQNTWTCNFNGFVSYSCKLALFASLHLAYGIRTQRKILDQNVSNACKLKQTGTRIPNASDWYNPFHFSQPILPFGRCLCVHIFFALRSKQLVIDTIAFAPVPFFTLFRCV